MGKDKEWRRVDGLAILCTGCRENEELLGGSRCTAKDGICIFTKTKIDSQKTWSDYHDLYKDEEKEVNED